MRLTAEQARNLRRLVEIGYLPILEQWAKRSSSPIWWRDRNTNPTSGFVGGTVCIVNTGSRIIGVTAEHVHREIAARRAANRTAWCQVGAHSFDPEQRLIDADRELDLATYAFSEVTAYAAGVDIHHPPTWPPVAQDGDVGVVGGWPWTLSADHGDRVDHDFLHLICRLQVSSPTQIGAATLTSASVPWGTRALTPGTNLGGLSGGPIYRWVPAPIEHLLLVGIVYEYQPSLELVLARPLKCIKADGTIFRSNADA